MDLLELEQGIDPAAHWYYRAKAEALKRALRQQGHVPQIVKDVGAGSGTSRPSCCRPSQRVGPSASIPTTTMASCPRAVSDRCFVATVAQRLQICTFLWMSSSTFLMTLP